ncbi:MAG: hypothetical protein D6689_01920 [Deltaproteobacteria bacterium]|nr:MAG: hypothetical protein D6689_01920 [Deltaproteobacteria bacterium]
MHWTDKLQTFDRRWIFLAMGIAVVLPLFVECKLPIRQSPMVRASFDAVEALDADDVVLLSLDLDPASTPELQPYFEAVLLQLKRKNVKIVIVTTWYAAPPLIEGWIRSFVEGTVVRPGDRHYEGIPDRPYKRNVDYVYLGFREGREATINRMATDLRGTYDGHTADGTPMDAIPWLANIHKLEDFDLIVMVSAGYPGIKEYVQQASGRGDVKMTGACTAVSLPDYTPYFNAGQLAGLVGGMKRAAEYELLVGRPALGVKGTGVLNAGHMVVIFAIVFGNLIYFAGAGRRRRRGGAR